MVKSRGADPPQTKLEENTPALPPVKVHVVKKRKGKHREHELVGIRIRKRFNDGFWCNGVITSVKKHAKVKYANLTKEHIRIDHILELWKVSYQMYKLPSLTPNKRCPRLFPRGRNSKPYTLEQFMGLLQHAEQSHGGATIEELEASQLVRKKPGAKNTEVYGRMLPGATDVSRLVLSCEPSLDKDLTQSILMLPPQKIIRKYMNLQKTDVVVDIGHGIGNSYVQLGISQLQSNGKLCV